MVSYARDRINRELKPETHDLTASTAKQITKCCPWSSGSGVHLRTNSPCVVLVLCDIHRSTDDDIIYSM